MKTRRLTEDRGFTLIEVLVALFILMLGAVATYKLLNSATKANFRAEQRQVIQDVAQREMEKLHTIAYDNLALSSTPVTSADTTLPSNRVSGTTFKLTATGSTFATMVVSGTGLVAPGPTAFTSGDVSGKIYRYVVWMNDDQCLEADCPGSQDFKRAIVAVKPDTVASGGTRTYTEIQSDFIEPATASP